MGARIRHYMKSCYENSEKKENDDDKYNKNS